MKIALTIFAAAVAAANANSLRESVQESLEVDAEKNNAVCLEIYNSWWTNREEEKVRSNIVALDSTCSQWDGFENRDKCNFKSARGSSVSAADKKAACVMVGAHNYKCQANPCNQYNTGKCTVQDTSGQCMWFTKSDMNKANKHWQTKADEATSTAQKDTYLDRKIPSYGCHRNPCNKPGYKNEPRKLCRSGDYNVPDLYKCTWCNGEGKLKGKGMGCQATTVETNAACAKVNGADLQSSVYYVKGKSGCQCSADYTLCEDAVSNRNGNMVKKK